MLRSPSGVAVTLACTLALSSFADVLKHPEVKMSNTLDRRVLFGMAVTPSGDVLSLIAKKTGNWQFYRVRRWNEQGPLVDSLTLPGYPSKSEGRDLESLSAQVFTTSDGTYAVCVASAEWLKRIGGRGVGPVRSDDVIALVDLTTFSVVKATHTKDLNLLEFHDIQLDRNGTLLADSRSRDLRRGAFTRIAIPSLIPDPVCNYNLISDQSTGERRQLQMDDNCRAVLGTADFSNYFLAARPTAPRPQKGCGKNTTAAFCRDGGSSTADGRFGIATVVEGHDRLFDRGWIETNKTFVVFSVADQADIGEIRVSTRSSVRTATTNLDGRDYLVIITNGTILTPYELMD